MFYQSHKLIKLQFKPLGKLKINANIDFWRNHFELNMKKNWYDYGEYVG